MFMAIPEQEHAHRLARKYSNELKEVVDRLVLIGVSPPTPRNVDALILLGSLAGYAFDVVKDSLDTALRERPLGFRVWRAVTTVVRLTQERPSPALIEWVRERLEAAEELRKDSLFPARSLDVELAIAIPQDWSSPGDDWVEKVLRTRARNEDASVRERGTAALGLWERAVERHGPKRAASEYAEELNSLINDFRAEADNKGEDALGLKWVADTLEHNLATKQKISTDWPQSGEVCLQVVQEAVDHLGTYYEPIATRVQAPTKTLIQHAVLQNEGVHRRHVIDALAAGGWTSPVTRILNRILNDDRTEAWLRCRALFAMGFVQDRSDEVAGMLQRACRNAIKSLTDDLKNPKVSRGKVSEVHTALFAIGDCFGVAEAKDQATALRTEFDQDEALLSLLTESKKKVELYPVSRAAAYLVTVTAQDQDGSSQRLLREMGSNHRDSTTKRLCEWALKRFDETGNVRPIHAQRE